MSATSAKMARVGGYLQVLGLSLEDTLSGARPATPVDTTREDQEPFLHGCFCEVVSFIENKGQKACAVFMHARHFADLRKYGRDNLTIETDAQYLGIGLMGEMETVLIITARNVPMGTILFIDETGHFYQTSSIRYSQDPRMRR